MKSDQYDVLGHTLLPMLQPSIQTFGAPQVAINAALEQPQRSEQSLKMASPTRPVMRQHTPASTELLSGGQPEDVSLPAGAASQADMDIAARTSPSSRVSTVDSLKAASLAGNIGLYGSIASTALAGLDWLAKRVTKSDAKSLNKSVLPNSFFNSAVSSRALKGIYDLSDTDTDYLYQFASVAKDPAHLEAMLRTQPAQGISAAARDHLLKSPEALAQLLEDARVERTIQSDPSTSARIGQHVRNEMDRADSLRPLALLGTGIGAVAGAASVYDWTQGEPEPAWYARPEVVAGAAGVGGLLLGTGAHAAYASRRGHVDRSDQTVLPVQKTAGIGTVLTSGLSSLLGTASGLYHTPKRFADKFQGTLNGMDAAQLEDVASAFQNFREQNIPARAARGFGLLGTAGALVSGAQSMIARREQERQEAEFNKNLPRFITGATAAGVALGGLANSLSQRAMNRALAPAAAPALPSAGEAINVSNV